jgi:hypothetical protein
MTSQWIFSLLAVAIATVALVYRVRRDAQIRRTNPNAPGHSFTEAQARAWSIVVVVCLLVGGLMFLLGVSFQLNEDSIGLFLVPPGIVIALFGLVMLFVVRSRRPR